MVKSRPVTESEDAVLADIEREQVDEPICLGDVTTLGPQLCEVVTRLPELDCRIILGNHEMMCWTAGGWSSGRMSHES